MKVMIATVLMFTLVLGTVSLAAKGNKKGNNNKQETPATTTAPATQAAAAAKPINKNCAVEQDNPIDAKGGTYVYKGQTIGFCCPDCIKEFKKDPEKYMKTIK
jgi:YHS domain-containing protein